jgi:hypothetical protein
LQSIDEINFQLSATLIGCFLNHACFFKCSSAGVKRTTRMAAYASRKRQAPGRPRGAGGPTGEIAPIWRKYDYNKWVQSGANWKVRPTLEKTGVVQKAEIVLDK